MSTNALARALEAVEAGQVVQDWTRERDRKARQVAVTSTPEHARYLERNARRQATNRRKHGRPSR